MPRYANPMNPRIFVQISSLLNEQTRQLVLVNFFEVFNEILQFK
jgi:hypothetical protein